MNNINRKLRTRKALMNSALELVDEGQHFSSLSIREVAKRAGVVPNAFYRHFKSLDELGLALGDEVGLLLRQLMRQARLQGLAADRMISDSVDFFMSNVMENPSLFRFMSQSLTGGSEQLRAAIRNELNFFATELVMDLNRLRILTHIEAIDLDMIGHLVVQTVSGIASEILDLPPGSDNLVKAIRQRTIKQVRLIFLGAGMWQSAEEKQEAFSQPTPATREVVDGDRLETALAPREKSTSELKAERAAEAKAKKVAAKAKAEAKAAEARAKKAAAKTKADAKAAEVRAKKAAAKAEAEAKAAEAKAKRAAAKAEAEAKAIEAKAEKAAARAEAEAKTAEEKAERAAAKAKAKVEAKAAEAKR
jgi:AcrR family transcriptional regulator